MIAQAPNSVVIVSSMTTAAVPAGRALDEPSVPWVFGSLLRWCAHRASVAALA
jgi:hypothetical protein